MGKAIAKIEVKKADNELFLIASTPEGSHEIGHIVSGHFKLVDYVVYPPTVLPPGDYTLSLVGINWGGPYAFEVVLTYDDQTFDKLGEEGGEKVGPCWTKAVQIAVKKP